MATYDPHAPPVRQSAGWNCSCASATWALRSLGFPATEAAVTSEMLALGLVTPEYGLMDGSGAGLARYLREKTGLAVINRWLSWADITTASGYGPICQGSNKQYHWSDVRFVDDDAVYLMNPAPGWMGVYDLLDRWAWESWGPWAGVFINAEDDGMTNDALQAENAQLKAQVEALEDELATERSWCSSAMQDTVTPCVAQLDQALLTQRPEDWATVHSVAESFHQNLGV